jgi:alpha-tubulin suppressor-like RCC1 family protein
MSSHLWQAYYEDDVDTFRHLLAPVASSLRPHASRGGSTFHPGSLGSVIGSPGQHGSSPIHAARSRKHNTPGGHASHLNLTKADINWRDAHGLTILHHAASSISENAVGFATVLIEHPLIDLYLQDLENGWTALHRAFYFGNITIARMILERNTSDVLGKSTGHVHQTLGLVKIKDREGLGPLDLFAATIKDRTLRPEQSGHKGSDPQGSDDGNMRDENGDKLASTNRIAFGNIHGDQLFTFGSNKNVSLGFGDEDDRQFPERINLRRPEHLVRQFYADHLEEVEKQRPAAAGGAVSSSAAAEKDMWIEDIPWVIRSRPLSIQDVQMSKLSTAVLTNDTDSNLYMCGHGKGGRLGTGDERTRYNLTCVDNPALAGKRIVTVALGLNHTLALSEQGEIFSWGSNGFGQLGYGLPKVAKDEEPISTVPRQIYGPLKREAVIGIAASRIHSVAHTASSLYTFGKSEGQLGIMDSDARSLESQIIPRKVAASLFTSSIAAVSAIDRATICLLENHDVWVFANYGYAKVQFPLDGFSNYFLKQSFMLTTYDQVPNKITKVVSAGDTICALSSRGGVYTLSINQKLDSQASASTTNPSKIRSAITQPLPVWSPKKNNMAARDVGVDADGSILVSTEEGSVWKRLPRNNAALGVQHKHKDYKFSRMPGLTRVLGVRSSGYGAYAAVRKDCDVLQTQIVVEDPTLWKDLMPLLSLTRLADGQTSVEESESRPRFWQAPRKISQLSLLRKLLISSADIEADAARVVDQISAEGSDKYDAVLATTTSDVVIPVHRWMLTGRSRVLREGFRSLCESSTFTILDLSVAELLSSGQLKLTFQGVDIISIINLALYLYTDAVSDVWHFTRDAPSMAYRYRTTRTDLMKIASKLELNKLETAVRQMIPPQLGLNVDFESAFDDPAFFHDADAIVQLEDDEVRVHSSLVCTRCPFFDGLFMGRAGGLWLANRGEGDEVTIDLKHINAKTFRIVLRHIYCDSGAELFDDIVSTDLDDFLDNVLDVMSAANELMLDRLSQIAQSVVGQYVNVRNVCSLLNAISPSSVREFKDAGLEYLCLNLEAMLQGHYLNELDEDLLEELDEVVRQNQLACMPFVKSGRAELSLHERHPELAAILDHNRRVKIDSVILRTKFHDAGVFSPGSYNEDLAVSPTTQRSRRRSSTIIRTELDRPSLKSKGTSKDLMFDMDEESDFNPQSPRESPAIRPMTSPRALDPLFEDLPLEDTWFDSRGKILPSPKLTAQSSIHGTPTPRTPKSPLMTSQTSPHPLKPWTLTPLSGQKTAMKDIMAQAATTTRTSSLSQDIDQARGSLPDIPTPFSLPAPKMSQKDRKRLQHNQQASSSTIQPATTPLGSSPFSWQAVSAKSKPALKDVMMSEQTISKGKGSAPSTARTSSTPQLTMRQTVANIKGTASPSPSPSPLPGSGSQRVHQQRSVSDSKSMVPSGLESPQTRGATNFSNSRPIPQSIRRQPVIVDPSSWDMSMTEILAQQQLEKDYLKGVVAKRDLQEIQAEQEFQEWWDKESARVQEAENQSAASPNPSSKTSASKKHRSRGGRGKGAKTGGGGEAHKEGTPAAAKRAT